jgi:hypothetical protein
LEPNEATLDAAFNRIGREFNYAISIVAAAKLGYPQPPASRVETELERIAPWRLASMFRDEDLSWAPLAVRRWRAFLDLLEDGHMDFTNAHAALAAGKDSVEWDAIMDEVKKLPTAFQDAWHDWSSEYWSERDPLQVHLQGSLCPAVVPRAHQLYVATKLAEHGDLAELRGLATVLSKPWGPVAPPLLDTAVSVGLPGGRTAFEWLAELQSMPVKLFMPSDKHILDPPPSPEPAPHPHLHGRAFLGDQRSPGDEETKNLTQAWSGLHPNTKLPHWPHYYTPLSKTPLVHRFGVREVSCSS